MRKIPNNIQLYIFYQEAQHLHFLSPLASSDSFCSYKNRSTKKLNDKTLFSQQVSDGMHIHPGGYIKSINTWLSVRTPLTNTQRRGQNRDRPATMPFISSGCQWTHTEVWLWRKDPRTSLRYIGIWRQQASQARIPKSIRDHRNTHSDSTEFSMRLDYVWKVH